MSEAMVAPSVSDLAAVLHPALDSLELAVFVSAAARGWEESRRLCETVMPTEEPCYSENANVVPDGSNHEQTEARRQA